jgi:hypothetical protein
MARYRELPVVVDATQWFKNGDHPDDYTRSRRGLTATGTVLFSAEHARRQGWEGDVVRYYRDPLVPGSLLCMDCGKTMHVHGWLDTGGSGQAVCPGDFVVTGVDGKPFAVKPDAFKQRYQRVIQPPASVTENLPEPL